MPKLLLAPTIVLASIILSIAGRSLFGKPTTKALLAMDLFWGSLLAIAFAWY